MPISPRGSAGFAAGLCLLMLASGWAPAVTAHNPAATLFHPVPVGDAQLVVGGEGTYAYLDADGVAGEHGNLSGEGEVLHAPATTGEQAAVVVRAFPDLVPHVQAFDDEGPTWRVAVGEAETFAYVLPDGDGFTAFSTEGRQVALSSEGDVQAEHELPVSPEARPALAEDGWWVPTNTGIARVADGEVVDERDYAGTPTDVTVEGEHVLVSLAHRERDRSTLMVYEPDLDLAFSRGLSSYRLGGQPAVVSDAIVVGTYHPDGARVVALAGNNGSIAWERSLPNATAAAPASIGDRIVTATTEGVVGFAADGTRLWTHASQPYIASPASVGDLAVASSADNELVALHPNGSVAWTWSDGVELPSWSHHGAADASNGSADADAAQETPGLGALVLLVFGLAALPARPRR